MGFDNGFLATQILGLLIGTPVFMAEVFGLIVSLMRLGARPRAAAASAIGFGGLILVRAAGALISILLSPMMFRGERLATYALLQGIISIGSSFLVAGCYCLIVYALFFAEKAKPEAPVT